MFAEVELFLNRAFSQDQTVLQGAIQTLALGRGYSHPYLIGPIWKSGDKLMQLSCNRTLLTPWSDPPTGSSLSAILKVKQQS